MPMQAATKAGSRSSDAMTRIRASMTSSHSRPEILDVWFVGGLVKERTAQPGMVSPPMRTCGNG